MCITRGILPRLTILVAVTVVLALVLLVVIDVARLALASTVRFLEKERKIKQDKIKY